MTNLDQAYAQCRAIARREAKNFYYAFIALPSARRDAICAVYAFMRQADDIADDESLPRAERRRRLAEWTAEWKSGAGRQEGGAHCPQGGARCPQRAGSTPDAAGESRFHIFLALADATERFKLPLELLEQLIAGVAMDLNTDGSEAAPQTYATFAELYRYCYLVASVVGLICIRIFGYRDSQAEKLAEETGIAFQLTNILRDVVEDAGRNRLYLPLDLASLHGVTVEEVLHHPAGRPPSGNERALLADLAGRAERYYESARRLLPLIERESRPALWVLISIYHRLLERIERADYDVFSRRASVPRAQKLGILLIGQARMALARGLAWS